MCRRVTCDSCGKPTFAGCGAHIEQVLGNVPVNERCDCRTNPKKPEAKGDAQSGASTARKWWQL